MAFPVRASSPWGTSSTTTGTTSEHCTCSISIPILVSVSDAKRALHPGPDNSDAGPPDNGRRFVRASFYAEAPAARKMDRTESIYRRHEACFARDGFPRGRRFRLSPADAAQFVSARFIGLSHEDCRLSTLRDRNQLQAVSCAVAAPNVSRSESQTDAVRLGTNDW